MHIERQHIVHHCLIHCLKDFNYVFCYIIAFQEPRGYSKHERKILKFGIAYAIFYSQF